MTDLLDRTDEPLPEAEARADAPTPPETAVESTDEQPRLTFGEAIRPLLVAALSTMGAALMTGGIFGGGGARLLAAAASVIGVGWAFVTYRAKNRIAFQVALVPAAFVLGTAVLVPTEEGPTGVLGLMSEAVDAGRLLRPPVPFDAGWRPLLTVMFVVLGFGSGWIALALKRLQLALLLPVPVLLLTAISQPAEGQVLGSILGFMPIVLALGVLFGGDVDRSSELGSEFELKRLVRAIPMALVGLAVLVALSQSDFLFPEPVYDPTEKPQKPKSIPLGEVEDRVLFEIDGELSGPWRVGVLDVYDGRSWRLPPYSTARLKPIPSDGIVDKTRPGQIEITFVARDLGDSSVLPSVSDAVSMSVDAKDISYDPRAGVFRMNNGRVPEGLEYKQTLQQYPTHAELRQFGPSRRVASEFSKLPRPSADVQALLDQAPSNPWDRLEFLRKRLNQDVVAVGAGNPSQPVPPSKVDDLLFGSKEGSPFEIVAAEVMLARWAGWPARIGFGFDGYNDEDGKRTIRPKNGSNWLEIAVEGRGWAPIIGAPPKAKASLDTDPNARFDETIIPSDEVAVELLIPVKVENLRQLYERIRAFLLAMLPFVAAAIALYLATPALLRARRRRKRLRWAHAAGPRAEIVVEYAELRDALYDLNVGDPLDTPLEYLQRCVPDDEHEELAWLVTRATYGDMAFSLTEADAEAAAELAQSVRRRMFAAQPFQSRVLAWLSRESLRHPYTTEVPTVRLLRLRPTRLPKPRVIEKVRQLAPARNR